MNYLIALICPPLAMVRAGRPARAIVAAMVLAASVALWASGVGVLMAAFTVLWACHVVGDAAAKEELDGFLDGFREENVAHH